MIDLMARWIEPGEEQRLRDWFAEVQGPRRAEALRTLADEGCRHEVAIVVETSEGPLLVYAMEVDDPAQARQAAATSDHPIDRDHKAVLQAALGGRPRVERVLDLRAG